MRTTPTSRCAGLVSLVVALPFSVVLLAGPAAAEGNGKGSGDDRGSSSADEDRSSSADKRGKTDDRGGGPREDDRGGGPREDDRGGSTPHGETDESPYNEPQEESNADANGTGANAGDPCPDTNAYCSTRDGDASANGNGSGGDGRPCAGCVGKADNKNPPGQAPDASDHNNGYECDGNSGIARTNPAHTGCGADEAGTAPCVGGTCEQSPCVGGTCDEAPCVGAACGNGTPPGETGVLPIVFDRPPGSSSTRPETTIAVTPEARVLPAAAAPAVRVDAPPSALPFTGQEVSVLALLSGYVLACGAYLAWVSRLHLFVR